MAKLALFLPSLRAGGAERVMLNLARGFVERGVQVDMVLAKAEGEYLPLVDSRVNVVDLASPRVLRALPGLRHYLRRTRPTAVLSALDHANVVAIWAKRLAGVQLRLAVTIHNTVSPAYVNSSVSALRERLILWNARRVYRSADAVIAVSRAVAEDFARATGFPRERIDVIYDPVDIDEVIAKSREPVDHPWFAAGEPPVILGAGRLTELKDFPTLLRAFTHVKQRRRARLVIIGEGEERPHLESLAWNLGVQNDVVMPGFVKNPYAFIRRATVLVLPSRWEGFGMVLVEAMALGTPVVATDALGGPREILEDGRWGRLVPVGDPEALAKAIIDVLDQPDRGRATQRAWDFSLGAVTARYAQILEMPLGPTEPVSDRHG